jgi:hypothetical protein
MKVPHFIGDKRRQSTLVELPPRGLKRWRARHKAEVVAAVRHGFISFDEACDRYRLSAEEYLTWQRSFDATPAQTTMTAKDRRD